MPPMIMPSVPRPVTTYNNVRSVPLSSPMLSRMTAVLSLRNDASSHSGEAGLELRRIVSSLALRIDPTASAITDLSFAAPTPLVAFAPVRTYLKAD